MSSVHTIITMEITFDPAKDAANLAKHGVSLSEVANLEWDEALVWVDARHDYGESRQSALVPLGNRLWDAYPVRKAALAIPFHGRHTTAHEYGADLQERADHDSQGDP